jgi:hypothetical protein
MGNLRRFEMNEEAVLTDGCGNNCSVRVINEESTNIYRVEVVGSGQKLFAHGEDLLPVGEWIYERTEDLTSVGAVYRPVMSLPTDSAERKNYPMLSGCLNYFPAALAGVSKTSKLGNDKHNPGQALHHARSKSRDHGDCIVRHLVDAESLLAALNRNQGVTSADVLLEVNQMVWRALAYSQELHERFGYPMAPAAKD